jgi:hypothetical protein
VTGREDHSVGDTGWKRTEARTRSLRWMEPLWEGANTTAREENHKDEVLAVFRELAREAKRGSKVREYVPWQPLW